MQLLRVAPFTMKELNRYDFANDRHFATYLLSKTDTGRLNLPECDVVGLVRGPIDDRFPMMSLRPDEALILARLLVDAVAQVTEEYKVGEPKPQFWTTDTASTADGWVLD